jgi:hypothetical protein
VGGGGVCFWGFSSEKNALETNLNTGVSYLLQILSIVSGEFAYTYNL